MKGTTSDVAGQLVGVVPGSYSYTDAAGEAGTYVRRAVILNAQNQPICTTNAVTVTFN